MLRYSTRIYLVVYTYKTRQNIFVFDLIIRHFNNQVYFGKCIYCYYLTVYLGNVILKK